MKKILSCATMALLISCSGGTVNQNEENKETPLSYDVFQKDYIKWDQVFDMDEERYLVYFYSEYCGYCKMIKEEFLSYYLSSDERIYAMDVLKEGAIYKSGADDLIGVDDIDDFYIPGTPFLAEICLWRVTNFYVGVESIRLYIKGSK